MQSALYAYRQMRIKNLGGRRGDAPLSRWSKGMILLEILKSKLFRLNLAGFLLKYLLVQHWKSVMNDIAIKQN